MWKSVGIFLPGPINLVANLPVLETEMIGHIGEPDPARRFSRSATAVIDCDHRLSAHVCSHMREVTERREPLKCVGAALVGSPMILIRKRTAGKPHERSAHLAQERHRGGIIKAVIPHGCIHTEPTSVGSAPWRTGIYRHV